MLSTGGIDHCPPFNVPTLSPKKKLCTSLSACLPESESASRQSLFPTLPLELLAEILIQTNSPRDILAVARTSKFFCSTLVCNPAADFIWRTVRKKCLPCALPDPTSNFSEAAYAAFVYDGGHCEMCKRTTNEFFVSFAARIRLCRNPRCRKNFIVEHLVDVTSIFQGRARDAIWIPYVESSRCFASTSINSISWPETPVLMRKSDWIHFRANYAAFSAPTSSEGLRKACTAQIARFPKFMELAVALQEWKCSYGALHCTIKGKNETWAKALARQEGWNVHDLLNCESYGSLHRRKTSMLEEVTLCDFLPIKPLVEAQLLKMQEHRQNRQNEASYRQRRDDVEQYYNCLRSAGTVVPSLSEFRKLPVMKTVQGSVSGPRPNSRGLALDLKKSGLVAELVNADLKKWTEHAREKLSELLGFPKWKSASKTKLHPLDRITARFRCRRCGKVSRRYETEGCLDFPGACAHECPNHDKKVQKPVDWDVDLFVKDEKVSNAIARLLTLVGITDEDATASDTVKALGARIQCLSCEHAYIVMDFSTFIGHSHRHDDMQLAILPVGEVPEHEFKSGLSAELMDTSFSARRRRTEAIYWCYHCIPAGKLGVDGEGQVSRDELAANTPQNGDKKKRQRNKSKSRPMDFNALRSHLKERHKVEMVSDEDFFVQKPVGR